MESAMKHSVDAHVGKRIRHQRWMVGMTQQQLAEKVGIKFQQVQKYETGMNRDHGVIHGQRHPVAQPWWDQQMRATADSAPARTRRRRPAGRRDR